MGGEVVAAEAEGEMAFGMAPPSKNKRDVQRLLEELEADMQ